MTADNKSTVPHAVTPLPAVQIMCLFFIQLCETLNTCVLFPFMAFMVEDFGYEGQELGKYVGLLGASFCGAQFFSSVYWGKFSDDYGRKPAVLVGTFGTIFGMLLFGLAKSYPQAVCGRILAGLLSGNIGVMKTYVVEITDDTNRGIGFSYMSVSWSIGSVIAPLFGGLLSNPVSKYPSIFKKGSVFDEFPYFLPCLCCVILLAFSVIICSMFMKETRVWNNESVEASIPIKTSTSNGSSSSSSSSSSNGIISSMRNGSGSSRSSGKSKGNYMPLVDKSEHGGDGDGVGGLEMTIRSPVHDNAFSILGSEQDDDDDDNDNANHNDSDKDSKAYNYGNDDDCKENGNGISSGSASHVISFEERDNSNNNTSSNSSNRHRKEQPISDISTDIEHGNARNTIASNSADNEETDDDEECNCFICKSSANNANAITTTAMNVTDDKIEAINSNKKKSPLVKRNVIIACLNYAVLCMAYILFDETLPLYLKLDVEQGGFSFQSTDIGSLLSLPGIFMIGFASFFLPKIAKQSKKSIFRTSVIICALHIMLWPLLGKVHYYFLDEANPKHQQFMDHYIYYPLLLVLILIKSIAGTVAFMAVNMQIGHSVFDEDLGTVNGFGQSLAAMSRGIGPAVGGLLWSISIGLNFVYLNFFAMVGMLLLNLYLGNLTPVSLDFKKKRAGHGHSHGHKQGSSAETGGKDIDTEEEEEDEEGEEIIEFSA